MGLGLFSVSAEEVKMDGGAAFGVVPKLIWEKLCRADDNNLIDVSLRCLLVKDGDRLILIETGCGDKQSEKFYSYLYVKGRDNLRKDFAKNGFSYEEVTDVVMTHLHYDHCGGALKYGDDGKSAEPVFRNARYWCSRKQWERATNPYAIERPSYFAENYKPLESKGLLNFVEGEMQFTENIYFKIVNGHTTGQLIPVINYKGRKVVFMSDFIVSSAHIQLTYIPAYDYEPLVSLKEKEAFLKEAVDGEYILYFYHDYQNECCTVKQTEKGYMVKELLKINTINC